MDLLPCHLGIDDTDSLKGGCTTYVAALLVERLLQEGAQFFDYPNLIRLNPNIPYKTKGNGAVALRFFYKEPDEILPMASGIVEGEAGEESEPALALLVGEVSHELEAFSRRCLHSLVGLKEARRLVKREGIRAWGLDAGGGGRWRRGIIGALAAIGNQLEGDHTYELLCYRRPEYRGRPRAIDPSSVRSMDEEMKEETFNNIDEESGRVLITPRGPDPVLLGIRGENPQALLRALKLLRIEEPMERYCIFRSNQGTGEHLLQPLLLGKAYRAGHLVGTVAERPTMNRGGHAFITIASEQGKIRCAAYEPTGGLRQVLLRLMPGDLVEVGGCIRRRSRKHDEVLNLEYLKILKLVPAMRSPLCPHCSKGMKSMGRGKGFRCSKCGYKDLKAVKMLVPRDLSPGLHLPPPRSQRHLTKPLKRIGKEKEGQPSHQRELIEGWYWVESEASKYGENPHLQRSAKGSPSSFL